MVSNAYGNGLQGKSDSIREEHAAHPEGSLAAPGGWERSSSLVVPDVECWSALDGLSKAELEMPSDFTGVRGNYGDDSSQAGNLAEEQKGPGAGLERKDNTPLDASITEFEALSVLGGL